MDNVLVGRSALITGAGSGIGAATARAMAAAGAGVALFDVNASMAREVAASIADAGGEAMAVGGDVSVGADLADAIAETVARFGGLDIAVANAGIQLHSEDKDLHTLDEAVWDRTHAVNYRGVYLTCKHALAEMVRREHGVIAIVSSITALAGTTPNVAYASGKAGVLNLNRHIAVHYASRGIRSFAVCPGALERTPDWHDHPDPRGRLERMTAQIPMRRLGTPEEIACVIAFLAGPGGSYVNGASVVVDGGLTVS